MINGEGIVPGQQKMKMNDVVQGEDTASETGAPVRTAELWLVRHGQTDWNLYGRYQGHSDIPLNHTGQSQAAALARSLDGARIVAVYSSDLQRALSTAHAVADRREIPVVRDARLREVFMGGWEGLTVKEIMAHYPMEWERRERDPLNGRPPQGESIRDLAERVIPAIHEIAARHAPGPVLVVAHGLALATVLCRATATPLNDAFRMIPENAIATVMHWPLPASEEPNP